MIPRVGAKLCQRWEQTRDQGLRVTEMPANLREQISVKPQGGSPMSYMTRLSHENKAPVIEPTCARIEPHHFLPLTVPHLCRIFAISQTSHTLSKPMPLYVLPGTFTLLF